MCGRMSLESAKSWSQLFETFNAIGARSNGMPSWTIRDNIPPSTLIPIAATRQGERRMELARWGLIANWQTEVSIKYKTFNARLEGLVSENPPRTYTGAMKRQFRCIIPMSGYYEWKNREPYYFQIEGKPLFAAAGLWDFNHDLNILSCTMITCPANAAVSDYHHRMPALLTRADEIDHYLSDQVSTEAALERLGPYDGNDLLIAHKPLLSSPR